MKLVKEKLDDLLKPKTGEEIEKLFIKNINDRNKNIFYDLYNNVKQSGKYKITKELNLEIDNKIYYFDFETYEKFLLYPKIAPRDDEDFNDEYWETLQIMPLKMSGVIFLEEKFPHVIDMLTLTAYEIMNEKGIDVVERIYNTYKIKHIYNKKENKN